jgi:RNA polymerase sigma-70 factor (ECF subfamily)
MDLTQHTFYVWATKGHQLRDISKVKTWLFTTLHRAFLAARRSESRFTQCDLQDVAEELPAASPIAENPVDSPQILSALAKVDEVYQAPVALFYLEDYAYKDIAAILDVPLGTIKSRIARGIVQLRRILLPNDRAASPSVDIPDESPTSPAKQTLNHHDSRLAPQVSKRGYSDWDLSTTLIREPIAAL